MTTSINNEVYHTAKELSIKFSVSMETIRDWRKNKGLKGYLIGQRKYLYSENEVEKFIKGLN